MTQKIVEYIIVEATNVTILTKYTNEKIKSGYQPFKSVVIVPGTFTFNYYQTMVKYEN